MNNKKMDYFGCEINYSCNECECFESDTSSKKEFLCCKYCFNNVICCEECTKNNESFGGRAMKLPKYKREYCCDECGLIWFAETTTSNSTVCPECGNSNRKGLIYACDSMAYAYAYNSIVDMLKEKGKEIHFHEGHPKHQKEQMNNLMRGND